MKKGGCLGIGIAFLAIVGILIFVFVSKYNTMVGLDEAVRKQWGNVENVYQKRADLVDNLVSTVQGAADFESSTLENVIRERANASKTVIDPSNLSQAQIDQFQQAQNSFGGALSRLMVVIEKYPDLKANQNFLQLQSTLESIESEIVHERKKFNDRAEAFNAYRNKIPNNFIAAFVPKFDEKGYFKAEEGADQAPEVEFDFGNDKAEGE